MPITVGALQNVPAPGDPIISPWAQQASGYVVHPFANAAAISASWAAAPNGSVAIAIDTGIMYVRRAGIWRQAPNTVVWASSGQAPNIPRTTTGLVDLFTFGPGVTYPYPTTVVVNCTIWAGFGSGQTNFSCDLWSNALNGTNVASPSLVSAIGGAYASMGLSGGYAVPANGDVSCKGRLNVLATGGGTVHNWASVNMTIYAG